MSVKVSILLSFYWFATFVYFYSHFLNRGHFVKILRLRNRLINVLQCMIKIFFLWIQVQVPLIAPMNQQILKCCLQHQTRVSVWVWVWMWVGADVSVGGCECVWVRVWMGEWVRTEWVWNEDNICIHPYPHSHTTPTHHIHTLKFVTFQRKFIFIFGIFLFDNFLSIFSSRTILYFDVLLFGIFLFDIRLFDDFFDIYLFDVFLFDVFQQDLVFLLFFFTGIFYRWEDSYRCLNRE